MVADPAVDEVVDPLEVAVVQLVEVQLTGLPDALDQLQIGELSRGCTRVDGGGRDGLRNFGGFGQRIRGGRLVRLLAFLLLLRSACGTTRTRCAGRSGLRSARRRRGNHDGILGQRYDLALSLPKVTGLARRRIVSGEIRPCVAKKMRILSPRRIPAGLAAGRTAPGRPDRCSAAAVREDANVATGLRRADTIRGGALRDAAFQPRISGSSPGVPSESTFLMR